MSGGWGVDCGVRVCVCDWVGVGFFYCDERICGVGTSVRVFRGGGRDVDGVRGRDYGDVCGVFGDVGMDECDGVEWEIVVFGVDWIDDWLGSGEFRYARSVVIVCGVIV